MVLNLMDKVVLSNNDFVDFGRGGLDQFNVDECNFRPYIVDAVVNRHDLIVMSNADTNGLVVFNAENLSKLYGVSYGVAEETLKGVIKDYANEEIARENIVAVLFKRMSNSVVQETIAN